MPRASRTAPPEAAPAPAPRVSRSEARNAEVRARLQPFAPDERPVSLRIAAGLAVAIGLGNLVAFLAGAEVSGRRPDTISVVFLAVLFLIAGYGMWQKRYWAVIGFQVILGFTIVFASLALLVASNVPSAAAVRRAHRPRRVAVLEARARHVAHPGAAARRPAGHRPPLRGS